MSVDIDVDRAPRCVARRMGDGRIAVSVDGGVTLVGTWLAILEHVASVIVATNEVATEADLQPVEPATEVAEPNDGGYL
jgi:hypothetical protein